MAFFEKQANTKTLEQAIALHKTRPSNVRLARKLAIIFAAASLVLAGSTGSFFSRPQTPVRASDLSVSNILGAINSQRELRNLPTLAASGPLSLAAQSKSDDMIARKYFSHVDPEGNYIWKKIEEAGYTPYSQLGENLAIEFLSTESLVAAWMNSPTHRANILQEGFRDQGMGLSFGDSRQGQYNSAIVNTFGTLLGSPAKQAAASPSVKKEQAVKTEPVPTQTEPKPPQKTSQADPKPAPAKQEMAAVPAPAPEIGQNKPDLQPRHPAEKPLAKAETSQPAENSGIPALMENGSSSAPVSAPPPPSLLINDYLEYRRWLMLAFGTALLALLAADVKNAFQNGQYHLDKKFGSMAVLAISLIVVAVMYWL